MIGDTVSLVVLTFNRRAELLRTLSRLAEIDASVPIPGSRAPHWFGSRENSIADATWLSVAVVIGQLVFTIFSALARMTRAFVARIESSIIFSVIGGFGQLRSSVGSLFAPAPPVRPAAFARACAAW